MAVSNQDIVDRIDALEVTLSNEFVSIRGSSILYERYNTTDNDYTQIYDNNLSGQTFIPQLEHTIGSVRLKLLRVNFPGLFTVRIQETDSGHPILPFLCSGTGDGNTLTTSASGNWYTILLGEGARLYSGTQYAITVRSLSGNTSNYVEWRLDTGGTYSRGNGVLSSNGGSSWSSEVANDFMFEEYNLEPTLTRINSKLPAANTG